MAELLGLKYLDIQEMGLGVWASMEARRGGQGSRRTIRGVWYLGNHLKQDVKEEGVTNYKMKLINEVRKELCHFIISVDTFEKKIILQ